MQLPFYPLFDNWAVKAPKRVLLTIKKRDFAYCYNFYSKVWSANGIIKINRLPRMTDLTSGTITIQTQTERIGSFCSNKKVPLLRDSFIEF